MRLRPFGAVQVRFGRGPTDDGDDGGPETRGRSDNDDAEHVSLSRCAEATPAAHVGQRRTGICQHCIKPSLQSSPNREVPIRSSPKQASAGGAGGTASHRSQARCCEEAVVRHRGKAPDPD